MRFYLISDNIDTQMGMRLSGIEGVVVHTSEEVSKALDKAMEMKDVGVVLMTELAVKQCREKVYDYKHVPICYLLQKHISNIFLEHPYLK